MTQSNRRRRPTHSRSSQAAAWDWIRPYLPLLVAGILVLISLYVRYLTRAMTNTDMEVRILTWYAKLQRHGILVGLGKDFYNYTPPYVYLIALATLTSSFIAPLTSIKIIAAVFDVLTAFMVYKLVRLRRPQGYIPVLAAAVFFAGPTMLLNSGVWGQADSTYMLFFLLCLYFLIFDRPWLAIASVSIALAIKPQGIFLFPLLLLMMLWGKLRWFHFLGVPVVYALCMAPAVALGRTWYEVFTAYTSQAGAGKALTHNGATLYVLIPKSAFSWLLWPAVVGAVLIFLSWVLYTWRTTRRRDVQALVLLALVCVTLVPFFLPNMRERYYYPADTFSLILAFMTPALWYVPILFQVLSALSYSMFLWGAPQDNLQAATLISIFTLILLLQLQTTLRRPLGDAEAPPPPPARAGKGRK